MKTSLLFLSFLFLFVPPLEAQTDASDQPDLELVALARPGFLLGIQGEYGGFGHLVPWLSVRYGTHNPVCLLSGSDGFGLLGGDCGARGLSVLAGVRLRADPWGPVEPYVTLGLGRLWWDEGEVRPPADETELTGTAHVGLLWLGLGRIRPRVEFGYESHINPWFNVGIGFVP